MKLKTYPYTDNIGWSSTRYEAFSYCKRKYYYNYYGRHMDLQSRIRVAYFKAFSNVALSSGKLTHDMIKVLLERIVKNSKKPIDMERFTKRIDSMIITHLTPNQQFHEVYYKIGPTGITIDEVQRQLRIHIYTACQNLINSSRFKWLCDKAEESIYQWQIDPSGFGETRVSGLKAFAKPDLIIPDKPFYHVFDWKTGKASYKDQDQICGYCWFVHDQYGTEINNINATLCYLYPWFSEQTIQPIDAVKEFPIKVQMQINEMNSYLVDVEQNIPKDIDYFERTNSPRKCDTCNYFEICK